MSDLEKVKRLTSGLDGSIKNEKTATEAKDKLFEVKSYAKTFLRFFRRK